MSGELIRLLRITAGVDNDRRLVSGDPCSPNGSESGNRSAQKGRGRGKTLETPNNYPPQWQFSFLCLCSCSCDVFGAKSSIQTDVQSLLFTDSLLRQILEFKIFWSWKIWWKLLSFSLKAFHVLQEVLNLSEGLFGTPFPPWGWEKVYMLQTSDFNTFKQNPKMCLWWSQVKHIERSVNKLFTWVATCSRVPQWPTEGVFSSVHYQNTEGTWTENPPRLNIYNLSNNTTTTILPFFYIH